MALDNSSDWQYYKSISLSDTDSVLSGSQLLFHVYSGNGSDSAGFNSGNIYCGCSSSNWPNDIRFGTTSDPTTAYQIPQWYERSSNSISTVWIRPCSNSTTIYFFVGNNNAGFYSTGHAVWDHFDGYDTDPGYSSSGSSSTTYWGKTTDWSSNNWRLRQELELSGATSDDYPGNIIFILQNVPYNSGTGTDSVRHRIQTDTDWGASTNDPGIWTWIFSGGIATTVINKETGYFHIGDKTIFESRIISDSYYSSIAYSGNYSRFHSSGISKPPQGKLNQDVISLLDYNEGGKNLSWDSQNKALLAHVSRNSDITDVWRHSFCLGKWYDNYPYTTSFGSMSDVSLDNISVTSPSGALNIDNVYPSATLTGKVSNKSGNMWFYWGISDGGEDTTNWDSSGTVGVKYQDDYFEHVISSISSTDYRLSGATDYYFRVYGSSNGWGTGEDWSTVQTWTTKSPFRIYFLSGTSSSTPITASTDGYLGSSQIPTNKNSNMVTSGSVTWTGLEDGKKYAWHAYLESGGTWSEQSEVWTISTQLVV